MNKYGYTNVILDITNAIQSDTEGSERLSSISDFGQEPILIHPQQQPSPLLHLSNSTTNNTTKHLNSSKQVPGSFVPTNSDGRMQIRPPSVSEQVNIYLYKIFIHFLVLYPKSSAEKCVGKLGKAFLHLLPFFFGTGYGFFRNTM